MHFRLKTAAFRTFRSMKLRRYQPSDCKELFELFFDTVHVINAQDYSEEQLDAWASGEVDLNRWNRSFLEHYTIVAVDEEKIVGFGDITKDGYLDRLFVHAEHQRIGIATAICDQLEQAVDGKILTQASITAVLFLKSVGTGLLEGKDWKEEEYF